MSNEAEELTNKEAERVEQEEAKKPALPGMGHNVGGVAGDRLRSIIQRIERLEEEKKGLGDDIKDIYAEAKGAGFDTPTIRKIVKLNKKDAQKRREEDELLELYKSAIGMV